MPTTVRTGGTKIHAPANAAERIAAFRDIVTNKQYAKIDGTMIDLFTASLVVQVYDALNDENKQKLMTFPAARVSAICYQITKKK